jgi:hypothetical protein
MLVEVHTDKVKDIVVNTDREQSQEPTVEQIRKLLMAADTIDLIEFD